MTHLPSGSDELESAYADYRSTVSAWRAAVAVKDLERVECAAERLIGARVTLYRALTADGWGAPAPVVLQLERDAALLAAPTDFDVLLAQV